MQHFIQIFPRVAQRTWRRRFSQTYARPLHAGLAFMAGASVMLTACAGDSALTPRGSHSVSLSFMTAPTTGTTGGGITANLGVLRSGLHSVADIQAVSGTDTLVITKAQIVLSRLELSQGTGGPCEEEDSAPGCTEVERSFVLVDLPVDTTVVATVNATIPAGTYASLEARLRVPRADSDDQSHDAATFLAAHPEFQGANVRVEGTFHGTPFVYMGGVNAKLEMDFSPPLAVDSTGLNVTIHVDLASWFQDGTGALIDPSTANTGGANAQLVLDNIRNSFRAFRDDHRDGHDDGQDGGHNGDTSQTGGDHGGGNGWDGGGA